MSALKMALSVCTNFAEDRSGASSIASSKHLWFAETGALHCALMFSERFANCGSPRVLIRLGWHEELGAVGLEGGCIRRPARCLKLTASSELLA